MINTLINGALSVSITIINWLLTPIYNLIENTSFGNVNLGDLVTNFNSFVSTATTYISWVIDALGIPKPLLAVMVGIFGYCIIIRIRVFIVKLVLKLWDRVVA